MRSSIGHQRNRRFRLGYLAMVLSLVLVISSCSSDEPVGGDRTGTADSAAPKDRDADKGPAGFGAIEITDVPLPDHVFGINATPRTTADGDHLVVPFRSTELGGPDSAPQLGLMGLDGSAFTCLTCDLPEPIGVIRPFPFPDGKRIKIEANTIDVGETAGSVLECTPSVLDCQTAVNVPINPPTPTEGAAVLQDREWRLAPDGEHIMWSQVRDDIGTNVTLGRIVRQGTDGDADDPARYEIEDARIVVGGQFLSQDGESVQLPDQAMAISNIVEGRAFADGGRSILFLSSQDSMNFDLFSIDLESGDITRITRDIEYEDPITAAPDGSAYVVVSTRGVEPPRMAVFAQIPRPPIIDAAIGVQIAFHRNDAVSRRRYMQPWLLGPEGDPAPGAKGGITPQQLDPDVEEGWNGRADVSWSDDGTRLLYWEQADPATAGGSETEFWTGRIRTATFTDRTPTEPPTATTPEPSWAPLVSEFTAPDYAIDGRLEGATGGYADVSVVPGAAPFLGMEITVSYHDYSYGCAVLNGTESAQQSSLAGTWTADIEVTGCQNGALTADLAVAPSNAATGTITSTLDGTSFEGVPNP